MSFDPGEENKNGRTEPPIQKARHSTRFSDVLGKRVHPGTRRDLLSQLKEQLKAERKKLAQLEGVYRSLANRSPGAVSQASVTTQMASNFMDKNFFCDDGYETGPEEEVTLYKQLGKEMYQKFANVTKKELWFLEEICKVSEQVGNLQEQ